MPVTADLLRKQFNQNGWQPITVTCPDGTKAVIRPFIMPGCPANELYVQWYFVACGLPWADSNNLETVVNTVNNHAALAAAQKAYIPMA